MCVGEIGVGWVGFFDFIDFLFFREGCGSGRVRVGLCEVRGLGKGFYLFKFKVGVVEEGI